jgi:hypothetical protein
MFTVCISKFKSSIGLIFLLIGFSAPLWAQSVAINEDGSAAHSSAILDLKSTTKGVLLPRMTKAQREAIAGPATGLIVYQTSSPAGYYYYNGSSWDLVGNNASPWKMSGIHIIPTDNVDAPGSVSSVGIGVTTPRSRLHVAASSTIDLLRLENINSKIARMTFHLEQPDILHSDAMVIEGSKLGSHPRLKFFRRFQNLDIIGQIQLVDINSKGDTVLTAYGDILSEGVVRSKTVSILNEDPVSTAPELIMQSTGTLDLQMRRRTSNTGSYNQMILRSNGTNLELLKQSYTVPVLGSPSSSISQVAEFGDGYAMNALGDIKVNKEVHAQGTGTANMIPIAYGFIRDNGAVSTGSGNIASTWSAANQRYEITITGEDYVLWDYITMVTPSTGGISARVSSVTGKLLVEIYNAAGTKVQGNFQFLTYKP